MKTNVIFLALGILATTAITAPAAESTQLTLTILDRGEPVDAAAITVFLSCDKLEGTTAADGVVELATDCAARHYWVEIDGRRVSTLFEVERATRTIDLANVTFITWQGGR